MSNGYGCWPLCGCILCVGLSILSMLFLFADINVSKGGINYHILTDSNSTISLTTTYERIVWPKSLIKVECDLYKNGLYDGALVDNECKYLAQNTDDITKEVHQTKTRSWSTYFIGIHSSDQSMSVAAYWMTYKIIIVIACLITLWLFPIPIILMIISDIIFKECFPTIFGWGDMLFDKPKYMIIPYFTGIVLWSVALIMVFCPINYESSYKYSAKSTLEIYFSNNPNDLMVDHDDITERAHGHYILIVVIFGFYCLWFLCYWLLTHNDKPKKRNWLVAPKQNDVKNDEKKCDNNTITDCKGGEGDEDHENDETIDTESRRLNTV
eukprot:444364_1